MPFFKNVVAAGLLASLLSQSACYDWEMVKPVELPKLNNSFAEPVSRTANTTIIAVSVADVEREDGTLTRIRGSFDLRLVLRDGGEITFHNPVRATRDGDDLLITGSDRPETRVPLANIAHAEVSQPAPGKTMGLTVGLTVGFMLVVGVAVFAVVSQNHP
jgi:hypothetical protein